jgi:protocatechuate 3,4-dioxygenase beta subunit
MSSKGDPGVAPAPSASASTASTLQRLRLAKLPPQEEIRCALAGRVLDNRGEPIAGAMIELVFDAPLREAAEPEAASSEAVPVQSTDARGGYRYRYAEIPHGGYVIHVNAVGHVPAHEKAASLCDKGDARIDFTLEPGGIELSGTVGDVTGGPIPGARVSAWWSAGRANAVADDSGRYTLSLPRGDYYVNAHHENYVRGFARVNVAEPNARRDFELGRRT